MIGHLIALLVLASNSPATFNLVCDGSMISKVGKVTDSKPFKEVYRVDLKRGRWCTGKCQSTKPIHAVTDDEIIFQQWKDGDTGYLTKVNRETGQFVDVLWFEVDRAHYFGKCVRAPFTGLPDRQF